MTASRWDSARAKKLRLPGAPVHTCHARGCHEAVPERMLMCRRHWRMVPPALQRRVWAEYVPGQEVRKDPTSAYLEVAQAAIDVVFARESSEALRSAAAAQQLGLGL